MGLIFEFATASQIIFGNNSVEKVPDLLKGIGNNVLFVTGKNTVRSKKIISELLQKECKVTTFSVNSEPTIGIIDEGVNIARVKNCNVVIGFGGGSVVDSAKAIAAMIPNKGVLLDYLEVIGQGNSLIENPLPCIAIPTTAGTGAEVTKNSVIKSTRHNVKVSLRSNKMYPDIAVVDPVLTWSVPPELTASTGTDALTHLLETFVSSQSNSFIDNYCREGLHRISTSLVDAYNNGNNAEARENMAMASMLGGIALANVKLGAVHGFAGPMGGMFPISHGEICACLLPAVMEVNINVLKMQKNKEMLKKYDELAQILTREKSAKATDGILWIENLIKNLQIPSLSKFGLTESDFPELIQKAKNSSSMKGNSVLLHEDDLRLILKRSL